MREGQGVYGKKMKLAMKCRAGESGRRRVSADLEVKIELEYLGPDIPRDG
jgi:hypothetical protein